MLHVIKYQEVAKRLFLSWAYIYSENEIQPKKSALGILVSLNWEKLPFPLPNITAGTIVMPNCPNFPCTLSHATDMKSSMQPLLMPKCDAKLNPGQGSEQPWRFSRWDGHAKPWAGQRPLNAAWVHGHLHAMQKFAKGSGAGKEAVRQRAFDRSKPYRRTGWPIGSIQHRSHAT